MAFTLMSIHSEYIEILQKIKKNKEVLDENTSELSHIVEASNSLLSNIDNASDLKLDAKISSIYSEVYLKLFHKNINGRAISTEWIVNFFNSNQSSPFFNQVLSSSRRLRFVKFIDFNLMVVKKERKCERLKLEIKEVQTPEENNHVPDNEISEFLVDLSRKLKTVGSLPYYKTVIDGDSFTKTIENVFNLSIAIRSKNVMLIAKDDIVYITEYRDTGTVYNEHVIEEIDYDRFLYLKKKYLEVTK